MDSDLILVGIDETGYGAIAGPITVCVCVVKPEFRQQLEDMNFQDSKACSPEERYRIATWIVENKACDWVIMNEPVSVIEKIGPWDSVCKAARTALVILSNQLGFSGELERFDIMLDGRFPLKGIPEHISNRSKIAADETILEVKIASILAKVHRDFYMDQMAQLYPVYEWDKNKGYGIGKHLEALYYSGPMPEHRLKRGVWKAVKNYWEKNLREMEPMPKWLAELNPKYAATQEVYRRELLRDKRERFEKSKSAATGSSNVLSPGNEG
jgi:ribonuclease HII